MGRDAKKEQREVVKIDRFPYFVAISIAFLLLNLFTGYRKLFTVMFFLLLLPSISHAQTFGSYLDSKKAEKLYQSKNFDDSAKAFEAAQVNDAENPTLKFNEGTALAKGKHDEDAVFNLNEATKKALSQGDYDTAAKSLYNEGVTQADQKNLKEAYDRLTKAIELSKISNQPEIEKRAREALLSLIQKQKQKSKEDQDKKDQQDQQDKKDDKQQDKQQPSKPQNKDQGNKDPNQTEDGKKRQFKSGTISKDVAESIMNDLSDREKQLYQHRLKERKTRETPNEKDW
jgi:hypothetical protein